MPQISVTVAVQDSINNIIKTIRDEIIPAVNERTKSQKNLKVKVYATFADDAKDRLSKELSTLAKELKLDGFKITGSIAITNTKQQIRKDLTNIKKSFKDYKIGISATINPSATKREIRAVLKDKIVPAISQTFNEKIPLMVDIDENKSIDAIKTKLEKVISGISDGSYKIELKDLFGGANGSTKEVKSSIEKAKEQLKSAFSQLGNFGFNPTKNIFSEEFLSDKDNEKLIDHLTDAYAKYTNAIEEAKRANDNFNISDTSTWGEDEEVIKNVTTAVKEFNQAMAVAKSGAKADNGLESQAVAFENIRAKATGVLNTYKDYLSKTPDIIAATKKLQELMASGTATPLQIKQASSELEKLINEYQRGEGVVDKFNKSFSDKLFYGVAAAAAMLVRRGLRQVYQAVKDIDDAMVELKRVTNETSDTYNKVLDVAIDKAKKLGTGVATITNAIADFARLGYSVEEATNLAEVATVYTNVGDDVNDIGQATQSIISTMKAFGIAASDAMEIVDKFNDVGNNFAISAGGIGDALQRSAASLSFAGNSVEQSIGLVVGANDVVQNAETVGKMYADIKNNYIG